MSKKERAREYTENILSPFYPTADPYFNSYELEEAFEDGWDASFKETINYLEILMERNSLPLGLQKAIVKELKHFVMEE